MLELAGRVPGLEPDGDVIKAQVKAFKTASDKIIEALPQNKAAAATVEENPMAKFLEEMKVLVRDLPSRVTERMHEAGDPGRRRKSRRFHPMMLEEMMHMSSDPDDPIGILVAASVVRDEMPWFYEIALETYRAIKSGDAQAVEQEIRRLRHLPEMLMRGPFMEEFGSKDMHMFMMEFPRMFEHVIRRCMEAKKPTTRPRSAKTAQ